MKKIMIYLTFFYFSLFMTANALSGTLIIDGQTKQYTTISIDQSGTIIITTVGTPPPTGNQITGRVYSDYNGDSSKRVGIPNVTITPNTGTTTTTDTNGYYTLSGLADGTYTLIASKTNYTFNLASPVGVPPNQTINFTATPTATFSIAGNVKDKNSVNLQNIKIELSWGSILLDNTDLTDLSGNYLIENLIDGITYNVKPAVSGYTFNPSSKDVLINGSSVTGQNFMEQSVGKWSQPVAGATPINTYSARGYYIVENVTINKNGTYYFLIDPKGFNIPYVTSLVYIDIRDIYQSEYINIYYPILYKLDANNNELAKYIIPGSGDFSKIIMGYTQTDYNQGVKYLLEIIEKGKGSQSGGVSILWKFN